MSKKQMTQEEFRQKLMQPGPRLNRQPVKSLGAPLREMGIEVTLDDVRPYDRNPRTERNPRYDEIKASIREVGLKNPPVLTQRPEDDKYMISDGGNTRLEILTELYAETGDEKYYKFHAIYRPWISEAAALAGHLSENENRGELNWLEKSQGVMALKKVLEEIEGKSLSQRALVSKAKELGFSVEQSHISRMLYTLEHLWPTFPLTLKNGMGQPQIKTAIRFREATQLIWQHCDIKPEEAFAPAWHETMVPFDRDDQTVIAWEIAEDRLLGMLQEEMGMPFPQLDHALSSILRYRQQRIKLEDHYDDIWRPLDVELGRAEPVPRTTFPPLPEKKENQAPAMPKALPSSEESNNASANGPALQIPPQADDESSAELEALRRKIDELQEENAHLEETNSTLTQQATTPSPKTDNSDNTLSPEELDGLLDEMSDEERQKRLDDQTLSPVQESEGHRQLRAMLASQEGGEPIDFEANAVRSIPLMSDGPEEGPHSPILDIWTIEPQYLSPEPLRRQINTLAQGLARWAGFCRPGDDFYPMRFSDSGIGYHLEPLTDEQAQNPRSQKMWQLLASLAGEPLNPMYPDAGLLGELMGTCSDEDALPDALLVRYFRLVRMVRVLREENAQ